MVRYYFNLCGSSAQVDIEGLWLPTIEHARREAVRAAGQALIINPGQFWTGEVWTMNVLDDFGNSIFGLQLAAQLLL